MKNLVVVNNPKDWNFQINEVEIASAKEYLTDKKYFDLRNIRVYNLCRSYRYQSTGYYVSLIAEARGHKSFPNVATIQDLKNNSLVKIISEDLDLQIQNDLKKIKSKEFTLSIYFEQNIAKQYKKLSKQLANLFQAPLLRAHFVFNKKWVLQSIRPIPVNEITEAHKPYLEEFARTYFAKKRIQSAKISKYKYELAILVDPNEKAPPSDKTAIENFMNAADNLDLRTTLITKDDFNRLPEFDALFIRETTSVNHHTYKFSRRAFTEGLVVIDDPASIIKCTNKVYLAELLTKYKIHTPKTMIVHKENQTVLEQELGFPMVLKQPDSSFSQGVIKVENSEELQHNLKTMLDNSDLVIAQEYLYSEFDWRIGVLDKKPVFACQYFMAKDHWQIYNWKQGGDDVEGEFKTFPIDVVDNDIVKTAVKAANLIGDGLYGVDLKKIDNKVYVIEVNDNPSITSGVEDAILQQDLYRIIIESFYERLEKSRMVKEVQL